MLNVSPQYTEISIKQQTPHNNYILHMHQCNINKHLFTTLQMKQRLSLDKLFLKLKRKKKGWKKLLAKVVL